MVADYPAGDVADDAASDAAPDAASPGADPRESGAELSEPAATAQVVEFAVRAVPVPEPAVEPEDEPSVPAVAEAGVRAATDTAPPAADQGPAQAPAEPAPRRLGRRRARRGPNKREVRHQQTREAIVDAAAALFSERGFDAVSVQQIAQRAGVVEKTVFNHFPVKEGLVFEADPPMRAALVEAVRRRPAGESVAAAAGAFVVTAISQLGSPAAATGVAEMARVVRGSRILQAREREILGTLTDALAEQITVETRPAEGVLEPWLAANSVLGLYSALMEHARDRVLAGASGPELVAELQTRGERGLALLQFGLAGYAKRR
ncbi:transcriptional regulator, TetR family [Modestobacter sp. DSM 44400]|nr:transcriptional regulator, TetR family [Modestobacter sp. DSM 44400]